MVTIIDFKKRVNAEGKEFAVQILQGEYGRDCATPPVKSIGLCCFAERGGENTASFNPGFRLAAHPGLLLLDPSRVRKAR